MGIWGGIGGEGPERQDFRLKRRYFTYTKKQCYPKNMLFYIKKTRLYIKIIVLHISLLSHGQTIIPFQHCFQAAIPLSSWYLVSNMGWMPDEMFYAMKAAKGGGKGGGKGNWMQNQQQAAQPETPSDQNALLAQMMTLLQQSAMGQGSAGFCKA